MNCHIPRGWRFTSLLQCLIILSTRYSITVLGMFGITNGTDRASKDHAMMAQHGANANPDGTLAVDRSQIPSGNHARAQSTTEDAPRAPKEVTSTSSLLEQSRLLEHREQTRLLAQSRFGWDPAQHWRTNTHKPPVTPDKALTDEVQLCNVKLAPGQKDATTEDLGIQIVNSPDSPPVNIGNRYPWQLDPPAIINGRRDCRAGNRIGIPLASPNPQGANANPDGTLAVDRSQIPSAQSTTEDAPIAAIPVTSTSSSLEQSRFGWPPALNYWTNTPNPPLAKTPDKAVTDEVQLCNVNRPQGQKRREEDMEWNTEGD
eukprot:GHVQ01030024.1.p1 GENE.GHVQ01030024.1~~GHVQ01030024.1.p1  ORF type:complete len:316 (-),score=29.21 GHVQ01030024.1:223-1170(-)